MPNLPSSSSRNDLSGLSVITPFPRVAALPVQSPHSQTPSSPSVSSPSSHAIQPGSFGKVPSLPSVSSPSPRAIQPGSFGKVPSSPSVSSPSPRAIQPGSFGKVPSLFFVSVGAQESLSRPSNQASIWNLVLSDAQLRQQMTTTNLKVNTSGSQFGFRRLEDYRALAERLLRDRQDGFEHSVLSPTAALQLALSTNPRDRANNANNWLIAEWWKDIMETETKHARPDENHHQHSPRSSGTMGLASFVSHVSGAVHAFSPGMSLRNVGIVVLEQFVLAALPEAGSSLGVLTEALKNPATRSATVTAGAFATSIHALCASWCTSSSEAEYADFVRVISALPSCNPPLPQVIYPTRLNLSPASSPRAGSEPSTTGEKSPQDRFVAQGVSKSLLSVATHAVEDAAPREGKKSYPRKLEDPKRDFSSRMFAVYALRAYNERGPAALSVLPPVSLPPALPRLGEAKKPLLVPQTCRAKRAAATVSLTKPPPAASTNRPSNPLSIPSGRATSRERFVQQVQSSERQLRGLPSTPVASSGSLAKVANRPHPSNEIVEQFWNYHERAYSRNDRRANLVLNPQALNFDYVKEDRSSRRLRRELAVPFARTDWHKEEYILERAIGNFKSSEVPLASHTLLSLVQGFLKPADVINVRRALGDSTV